MKTQPMWVGPWPLHWAPALAAGGPVAQVAQRAGQEPRRLPSPWHSYQSHSAQQPPLPLRSEAGPSLPCPVQPPGLACSHVVCLVMGKLVTTLALHASMQGGQAMASFCSVHPGPPGFGSPESNQEVQFCRSQGTGRRSTPVPWQACQLGGRYSHTWTASHCFPRYA